MIPTKILAPLSPLVPFDVLEYNLLHTHCLEVRCPQLGPIDDNRNWVYDNRHGVD